MTVAHFSMTQLSADLWTATSIVNGDVEHFEGTYRECLAWLAYQGVL